MVRFIEQPDLASRMGVHSSAHCGKKYDVYKVNEVMLTEMGIE